MNHLSTSTRAEYVHEHIKPVCSRATHLKKQVDRHNLTEMWDMILAMDYEVDNVHKLSSETCEEFCDIIELLIQAFKK
ncbi:hypothetical protein JM93_00264 [Roseibium hamelinense]|uniref:Uncharacterized protein n=1 Tax=Roseibium hamelinense TaxID=150831 RepID=A0A562TGK5_9HYPH|nr:hypothetical protein [Roseibium hamelinense]MTI46088.1 hypothetical protein [Roseibium hamelinense]TWI92719.1 hypothetical protein JM93_00264 [Roseibium hamelinense]